MNVHNNLERGWEFICEDICRGEREGNTRDCLDQDGPEHPKRKLALDIILQKTSPYTFFPAKTMNIKPRYSFW